MHSFVIHGHFYQPPREDPLTKTIPLEKDALPYANWNERIYSECYKPNADLGNFGKISFNIGPTLFSWLEATHIDTYRTICAEDRSNVLKFGAGNAIAQPYNHTILPLSNKRDKRTQIIWGIADFIHRFGRYPKGIWLPESAVDYEVLNILAEHKIEFTILAPWQAVEAVDPTVPYKILLDSGKSITVFFYHQELSSQVSFNPWTTINADEFLNDRVYPLFLSNNNSERIVIIASDGELYGHHMPMRNFFLERLLDGAVKDLPLKATFPEMWLKEFKAEQTVEVRENTSWSCHHGLGRWLGECECTQGDRTWKPKLWAAFSYLGEQIDQLYFDHMKGLVKDPWIVRDQYIEVVLGEIDFDTFLQNYSSSATRLLNIERSRNLLEAQREKQKMFTSCGWFFDEFDRIEPRNNLAYAAKSVHLIWLATNIDISGEVREMLKFRFIKESETASSLFDQYLNRLLAA